MGTSRISKKKRKNIERGVFNWLIMEKKNDN